MKESEINVCNLLQLADTWFDMAFDSIEAIKVTIDALNLRYGYNFYDNDEDLSFVEACQKRSIKSTNIAVPLIYDMELLLKAVVISLEAQFRPNAPRSDVVRIIFSDVKKAVPGLNLHDLYIYMEYLEQYEDPLFMDILASLYIGKRKGKGNYVSREESYISEDCNTAMYSPGERISIANQKYRNAFIEFRYIFEKQNEEESIDLVKLMDYTESIRDICIYSKLKREVFQILKKIPGINISDLELQFSRYLENLLEKNKNGITIIELIASFKLWLEMGYGKIPPIIMKKMDNVIKKIDSIKIPGYAFKEQNYNVK